MVFFDDEIPGENHVIPKKSWILKCLLWCYEESKSYILAPIRFSSIFLVFVWSFLAFFSIPVRNSQQSPGTCIRNATAHTETETSNSFYGSENFLLEKRRRRIWVDEQEYKKRQFLLSIISEFCKDLQAIERNRLLNYVLCYGLCLNLSQNSVKNSAVSSVRMMSDSVRILAK